MSQFRVFPVAEDAKWRIHFPCQVRFVGDDLRRSETTLKRGSIAGAAGFVFLAAAESQQGIDML
jgi:hypothetical protein